MRAKHLLTAAALSLVAVTVRAGTVSPQLAAILDRTPLDRPISVIVNMADQAQVAVLNQELKDRHATRQSRNKEVIGALQTAQRGQAALRADLDAKLREGGVLGYTSYWISNLLLVQALPAEIERIAARADVDVVEPNFTYSLIKPVIEDTPGERGDRAHATPDAEADGHDLRGIGVTRGLRAIRAPLVWHRLGYTGAGRLIGSLDTGVDGTHPALSARWRGHDGAHPWRECWLDVIGSGSHSPTDGDGHGTHTTGTMTGLGAATEDTIGVAWGAQWIAANPINQIVSRGFDNDILTSLQWFADPDGDPETIEDVPDVVQNSWGVNEDFTSDPPYKDCDSRWWSVIDNCEAAGVCLTWSAGNEGPGPHTLRSPADRASSAINCFSIGAVDATHFEWPYPAAAWSARGPSGCNEPAPNRIKPEVVAPGVNVYSSIPDSSYTDAYSGTSMAGPHVAGVVALLREADPNLSVDEIKQILMDTARDEGTIAEDNVYGWGFIDAYAALLAATAGFGQIQGTVRNASFGHVPIAGARVQLAETGRTITADGSGFYSARVAAASYGAEAGAPGFESAQKTVVIRSGRLTTQDFDLIDVAGPAITGVTQPGTIPRTLLPFTISAHVEDGSTVTQTTLFYRIDHGLWNEQVMDPMAGDVYQAMFPDLPTNATFDYYVWARDGIGLTNTDPAGAPSSYYTVLVTELLYSDDAEDPAAPGWAFGVLGDQAQSGFWIRDDPVGTSDGGEPIQPEDDHTREPGVKCYVTGNAPPGAPPGAADVDFGCTTLQSPTFDLHAATRCFVTYWRWYGEAGNATDDEFAVDLSSDGGASWVPLERVPAMVNEWTRVNLELSAFIALTDRVQFRFRACDQGQQGLVEAAVDDFSLETFAGEPIPAVTAEVSSGADSAMSEKEQMPAPNLDQNRPNPFRPERALTVINFRLSNPAPTRLEIFDAGGRLVRTLLDGPLTSGTHSMSWDGLDDRGSPARAGVYFYRLKAGAFEQSRRMAVLK